MFKVPEKNRLKTGIMASSSLDGNNGVFHLKRVKYMIRVICSDGEGWEHVSVSRSDRKIPTWKDMCYIKDVFWDKEDCAIQYHPPESEYVNNHEACLHLWRPTMQTIPMPPSIMVGIKGLSQDEIELLVSKAQKKLK